MQSHSTSVYLADFPGARSALVQAAAAPAGGEPQAWKRVTEALGIAGADVGDRCETQSGAPRLTSVVRRIHQDDNAREVMLRVDEPAPGVAIVGACTVAGQARVMATVYLYGDAAADVAAAEQPKWSEWLRGVLDTAGAAT
ncbi:hypothetical protein ABQF17_12935 [Mycolicibacterium elephantis]